MKHGANRFDVIVVGGGHAGAEATHAAARTGARVALVTQRLDRIGEMSCNPAIGGIGKGHLVREIDAMDGLMGRAADAAGIQFRLLNRRKGPAVQGPRAQCDRRLYRQAVQAILHARTNLRLIEGEVVELLVVAGRVRGVRLADATTLTAPAVVLTTGTFLRGVLHFGERSQAGGRIGDGPSNRLADLLGELALPMGRLKTGTPPRLDGRTIDFARLEPQPGDAEPVMLSFLSRAPSVPQRPCHVTHTNGRTHDIIRANLGRSAMYSGRIDSTGPRYCPSIEDKVVRFAAKESHQIFLEPEGLDDNSVYPNGISTSLPPEVQRDYVRSVHGLEQAEILQPGYAIEYSYVDPRALEPSLALSALPDLYLAGQINGTTGYEEAAAQGLMAGLNAARAAVGAAPVRFGRADGYLGVMIDDLTTHGVTEPYRMFTSRAEFRLILRVDNADERLTPTGIAAGCVSADRRDRFERKMAALAHGRAALDAVRVSPNVARQHGLAVNLDGRVRTARDLLAYPAIDLARLAAIWPALAGLAPEIAARIENDARYGKYAERQLEAAERLRREEARPLPTDLDYTAMPGLSRELQGKLVALRPATMGQVGRIEGMTPAAMVLILAHARRRQAG